MKQGKARKSITLLDVARAAGVSRTTVSNAFNRPDQLSPEVQQKVLAVAKEMGYAGPNPMARMLRTGQTGAIGLIFSEALPYAFNDPVSIAFLQGVSKVCERVKASLLIVPALESDLAHQTIQQAAVDGFILYCIPDESEAVTRVLERHLPVVAVDQPELKGIPFIGIDDRQAARNAAEHLLSLDRQQLGIIAMDFHNDSYAGPVDAQRIERAIFRNALQRWRGYADAIRAAGLDPTLVPIEESPNSNGVEGAFAAAIALLQRHPRPTGILAMSDILALGALRAAEHLGLKVPEDVAIVGFDGIPLAAQVRPSLTTIQQPLVEKGAIAAEILLGIPSRKTTHILETKLVVRQSSSAVRGEG